MKPIEKLALELYKPPFKYMYGYIFDSNDMVFADNSTGSRIADEAEVTHKTGALALRVRGWGRLQYLKTEFDNGDIQDAVGELIVKALNSYWEEQIMEDKQ
tara:strand:- start:938 stop:1240 length:303 start_codon:yes stop_codon:yes gene_type:complete